MLYCSSCYYQLFTHFVYLKSLRVLRYTHSLGNKQTHLLISSLISYMNSALRNRMAHAKKNTKIGKAIKKHTKHFKRHR